MTTEVSRNSPLSSSRRRSALLGRRASPYHGAGPDPCVVFHIDNNILRAGISGEYSTRCILPLRKKSTIKEPQQDTTTLESCFVLNDDYLGEMEDQIEESVRTAINRYLYQPLKAKRIILVEGHYLPVKLKRIMARVLFTYHQPREITFLHASVCAALALGITSGIIVDIGSDETTIVPVYDRRPLHVLTKSTRYAESALKKRTRWLLTHFGHVPIEDLTTLDIDHFVNTALVCLPRSPLVPDVSDYIANEDLSEHYNTSEYQSKVFTWQQPSTERRMTLPQWIRFAIVEILFEARNQYADSAYTSIPVCVSSIIAKASIDIRGDLKTVAVTGSLCDIPGLQARIQRETGTNMVENIFGPDLAWTGASLAASLGLSGPSLTIQQFNSTSRVPDWTQQTRNWHI